jgi:hypothetical protein
MKQVITKVCDAGDSNDSETQNLDIGGELPSLDGQSEEYKEEQAFRRWVVAQVRQLSESFSTSLVSPVLTPW